MKYYAVAKGRNTGVYNSWEECKCQVDGFSGSIFKSFKTLEQAKAFLKLHILTTKRKRINLKRKRESSDSEEEIVPKKKRKIETHVEIFTDGGCTGNGTRSACGGIGVYFGGNDSRNLSKKMNGVQTNNTAELSAIIEALRICLNYEENVEINTDSEYAIKGITGVNRIKKNSSLFKKIEALLKLRRGKTEFKKVQGHSGLKDGNHYADLLATKAMNT